MASSIMHIYLIFHLAALFLAHLIHHQMCLCYQKLEIWQNRPLSHPLSQYLFLIGSLTAVSQSGTIIAREAEVREGPRCKRGWFCERGHEISKRGREIGLSCPRPLPLTHVISLSQSERGVIGGAREAVKSSDHTSLGKRGKKGLSCLSCLSCLSHPGVALIDYWLLI